MAIRTTVALLVVGGLVAFVVIVVWDRQPPELEEGQVVEGDGRKQWRVLDFVITIPDGARLVGGGYAIGGDGPGTWLTDAATGAVLYLSDCGEEYGRRGPPSANALFDELMDSVRLVDDPLHPACKPSE